MSPITEAALYLLGAVTSLILLAAFLQGRGRG